MDLANIPDAIQTYIDKFDFVEAKKYLALKGPLRLNIVHDNMFPLLRFNTTVILRKPPKGIRAGKLGCYWHNDQVHPCLITEVYNEGEFAIAFLNRESPSRTFSESQYLGEIIYPKLNWWWKFKLWRLRHRS